MKADENKWDKVLNSIEETKGDAHKMYKAVKILETGTTKKTNIHVKNKVGNYMLSHAKKCEEIAKWFEVNFNDPDGPIEPFDEIKPLQNPISCDEVKLAISRLKKSVYRTR